ncbi:trafficking protein particle complex subunit 11 [Chelonus insularis]|uniref:trafficking protein particle complex subunit 11 n=1 Tax=Chelonus insularis TaxID=460826 RepID=UPI00158CAB92|nr:trafficking protein particle complex subunit 11 [Chelonus insularis]
MPSADLPAELIAKPQALIGLSGLDISNTIHRSIWDTFISNRRADGTSLLQFKLLSPDHVFPTAKPKRNSYEWYIPKGILKRNWMNKYLNKIPAVVVCFYDLDWNDPTWNEKKMKCASKVQSLKCSLEGRNTKIAVVLIQRGIPPPPGSEDMLATERATALCTACELPAKSLYVLPHGDHLVGYILRLENVFYELAQNFYHHQYRVVKSHRDQLNKTSHQYLFVRHQFKMGFFNELRQDKHIALKHYQHAYNNLLEIRMNDFNTLEIKTVASYINYKLCRMMFIINEPRDAISQFRAHIDRFKSRTGPEDLIFEHHAWMTNQYSTFAELFDEAIRQGLPPVQTQHPGYYFQLAAQHANLRQKACKELCSNVTVSGQLLSDVDDGDKVEFYGQRPWKQINNNVGGKLSGEPVDLAREAAAIQVLKYQELKVNHSMIIISLLGNAISQFKIYRCPRMRRQLVVQMAAEYFNACDYGKVLTLLMHMLWEYRSERWPLLLTDILKKALKAAYLSTSIHDYITLAIESLGPFTKFSKEDRAAIYSNMMNIIYKRVPPQLLDLSDLPEEAKKSAIEKWSLELNRSDQFTCTIDDTNLSSFIDVKARFLDSKYFVGSPVNIEVFIKNLFEGTIKLAKIVVNIEVNGITFECPITGKTSIEGEQNISFKFEANETKKFHCTFLTPQQPDGSEMQISVISLYLGNENNFSIIMKFSPMGTVFSVLDRFYSDIQSHRKWSDGYSFETIKPIVTSTIKAEESNIIMEINSPSPALLSEWLPLKISIKPKETISSTMLHMKQITINTDNSGDNSATELSLTMTNKQTSISVELGNFTNKDGEIISMEKTVYVRSHQVSKKNFSIRIDYVNEEGIKRSKELTYSLSIVKPFDVTTQFYTKLFEPLTKAFVNEPFIMMPHVVCTSPWPIEILDTSVELGNSLSRIRNDDDNDKNHQESVLKGATLHDGESGTDVYCVVPIIGSEQPTSTGVYTIRWRRSDCKNEVIETSTSVTLSPIWVEDLVVGLQAKIPAHGWVRTPLCVSYFIKNYSDYLFTLRLTMEASDAFMFAGQKQIDICIPPKNEEKIEWILRPLIAGFVALPTLSLSVPLEDEYKLNKSKLVEILERSLPTHIYIMPKSPTIEA